MSTSVEKKSFSRDFFDRQDPTEGIGTVIPLFAFANIYDDVEKDGKLAQICDELYQTVLAKLGSGHLGRDVQFELLDYKDVKQGAGEPARRYLAITRETNRKTRITILARFLPYGNKLYVGVDSYVLGSTNWLRVIGILFLTILPFVCYPFTFAPAILQAIVQAIVQALVQGMSFLGTSSYYQSDSSGGTLATFLLIVQYTCCCILPWAAFTVAFLWRDAIRNLRQEGSLTLALRQSFNQILNTRSFNIDDILMTLKSILPLILSSIREVFEKHDISVKSLDEYAARLQTINNIQNVYGPGNAVAGAGGQASIIQPK